MKKLFSPAIYLVVTAALIGGTVQAQKNNSDLAYENSGGSRSVATKTIFLSPASRSELRALRNFNEIHKGASDVKWYYSGAVLIASFKAGNKQTRTMYLKNGGWLHTLVYYDASELSEDIKLMIHSKYRKYKISTVTEVHEKDMIFYLVNIENDTEIRQVIAYDNEVWTHQKWRKG